MERGGLMEAGGGMKIGKGNPPLFPVPQSRQGRNSDLSWIVISLRWMDESKVITTFPSNRKVLLSIGGQSIRCMFHDF